MARKGLEPQIVRIKNDPFQTTAPKDHHVYGQNWSYDYVLAFAVTNETGKFEVNSITIHMFDTNSLFNSSNSDDLGNNEKSDKYISEHSFAIILAKLKKAKLETKSFFSRDRSVVFVKIRASLERLCRQADAEDYKLPLDEERVRQRLAEGQYDSDRGRYRWTPKAYPPELMIKADNEEWAKENYHRGDGISDYQEYMFVRDGSREAQRLPEAERKVVGQIYPIKDDFSLCKWKYWQHHYATYTDKLAFDGLFHQDLQSASPFRGVDRCKLIRSIMESEKSGCNLNIGKLLQKVSS